MDYDIVASEKRKTLYSILAVLMIMPISSAFACVSPSYVFAKLQESDLVFSGIVSEVGCHEDQNFVVFNVHDIWKGEVSYNQTIYFPNCLEAKAVEKNTEHLVYAKTDSEGKPRSLFYWDMCASSILPYSREELKRLAPDYVRLKSLEKDRLQEGVYVASKRGNDVYYNLFELGIPKYSLKIGAVDDSD